MRRRWMNSSLLNVFEVCMRFPISIIPLIVGITTSTLTASDLFYAGPYGRVYITDEQFSLVCSVTDDGSYG